MVTGDGRLAAASASPEVQGMDRRIATGHVTGLFQGELKLRRNNSDSAGTTLWPQGQRFTNLTTAQSLDSQLVAVQPPLQRRPREPFLC